MFPEANHFVDVFGGSGVVIMNVDYPLMTYNDLNKDVVNFFHVLRDHRDEFIEQLKLTPYSRYEFNESKKDDKNLSDIEKARRFFIRLRQGFGTDLSKNVGWSYIVSQSKHNPAISQWFNGIDRLYDVYERLINIQIENSHASTIIQKYDDEDTFFYLDPPYVHSTRIKKHTNIYEGEMTDDDHRELAIALNNIKGKALVSGYRSELYDEIFAGWDSLDSDAKKNSQKNELEIESVWANYDINRAHISSKVIDETWNNLFC